MLSASDYHTLMDITDLNDFEAMLSNEAESTYECTDSADSDLVVQPGVGRNEAAKHAWSVSS